MTSKNNKKEEIRNHVYVKAHVLMKKERASCKHDYVPY